MAKKAAEKSAKELSEMLLNPRKNGFFKVTDEKIEKADKFCEGYKAFLNSAKTERESVEYAVAAAEKHGFVPFDPKHKYAAGDKVYYNNRGKAICLAIMGKEGCKNGVRIAAAHIDNPRLDLKPIPLYESTEMAYLKTHYYGGIKKYQWTAIPLAMHGVVVKSDGTVIKVCIGEEAGDPQFTITDILPHLGQDQATKPLGTAFTGEDLNILVGSRPVRDEDAKDAYKLNIMRLLNEKYGIIEADLISAEIEFVPAFKAVDIGFDRSRVGAYGHDDRVCAYPALEAILNCKNPVQTVITCSPIRKRPAATATRASTPSTCVTSSLTSRRQRAKSRATCYPSPPAFPPTSPRHMIRIMLPLTRHRTPPTSTAVWA